MLRGAQMKRVCVWVRDRERKRDGSACFIMAFNDRFGDSQTGDSYLERERWGGKDES